MKERAGIGREGSKYGIEDFLENQVTLCMGGHQKLSPASQIPAGRPFSGALPPLDPFAALIGSITTRRHRKLPRRSSPMAAL